MKRSALAFLLSTLSACAVHNTVADDDRTPSAQLASEVSASCASICDWAVQCPAPSCDCGGNDCSCANPPDPVTCPAQCAKTMTTYQGHGEACASAGLDFLSCLASATCANLYQYDLCVPSEAAMSTCISDDSNQGPSAGGAPGMAGSANSGGGPSDIGAGGSAGPVAPVRCDIGSGGGIAGSGNIGGSVVSCEQTYEGCADGHSYYTVCVIGDHAELVCSCFRDSTLQTSFAPTVECPALPEINAGCHWSVQN